MALYNNFHYTLVLLIHALLFVYWLGLDFGIFYLGAALARRDLPAFTRSTLCQILVTLDMIPRFALVLTLPVGATLTLLGGYVTIENRFAWPILSGIWLLSLGWVALIAIGFREPKRRSPPIIDRFVRLGVIALLLFFAATSALDQGPIDRRAGWLDTKLAIFAAIVGADMMIHTAFRPLRIAFAGLGKGTIPPEMEDTIRTRLRIAKPWVLASWVGLVLEAWLGLAKLF
jgi:hypothetical protein